MDKGTAAEDSSRSEGMAESTEQREQSRRGFDPAEPRAELSGERRRNEEKSSRRDFTIMPRRQAPPPPTTSDPHNGLCDSLTQSSISFPSPFDFQPLPEPAPPTKLPTCSTPQRTKSTTPVSHPPVSPPQYTVRSQPIGLSRSNSFSEIAPTISGGLTRRLSVSSLSSEGGEEADEEDPTDSKPLNRPLFKHRSESLPAFPPRKLVSETQDRLRSGTDEADLAQLPSNPKMWLPSHLALYLSNALSLHPALAADITAFIRNSRLSGRTFLRLKSADLEELGVNIRWRSALLEAGDKLRRESLGGRLFWGYEGGRQSDEEEEKDKRSKPQASIGLSYPTSSILPISHRRRPSLEVEGSASEDESSKEEWKRSWRRLNRGTNRVKGLAKTFETVIETSERSINVSPAGSPAKNRTDSSQRPSRIWSSHEGDEVSFAGSSRRRSESVDSNMSAASVDSFSGRYGSSNAIQSSSGGSHRSSPSLIANLSSPELDSAFARLSPVTPIKKSSPADQRVSFAKEFDWRLYPDSPGLRRNVDRESNGEAYEEEEEEEQTLKPVRTASTASGGSSGNYALSPASTEKRAGLADLFGLEMPKTRRETKKVGDGDEMVEMLVPGIDTIGKGGRKGSVVLIKKSQFAALQRRMSEVEAQVALALESNGLTSPRKLHSDGKENEVEKLEKSLIGLEHQTRLLAALATPDRSPLKDRNYHSPLCPTRSRSTTTDDEAYQEDPKTWWTEDTNPLGWRALGGYVVAASIGIGIVAGEVVASKLFGVRRR